MLMIGVTGYEFARRNDDTFYIGTLGMLDII